jgi:hypothetical protein
MRRLTAWLMTEEFQWIAARVTKSVSALVVLAVLAVVLSSVVGFSAQATAGSGWAPAPPPTWDEYLYALGSRSGGE